MGGQDVAFNQISGLESVDIAISRGDLIACDGLETAVMISLFSDRYVSPDKLPEGFVDGRGWWADALSEEPEDRIGSRLWLLDRGKISSKTKNEMKDYTEEALAWMVTVGLASKIKVTTTIVSNQRIDMLVQIYRPEGDNIPFKFIWDGQALRKG